jgi:hypothetical protein
VEALADLRNAKNARIAKNAKDARIAKNAKSARIAEMPGLPEMPKLGG